VLPPLALAPPVLALAPPLLLLPPLLVAPPVASAGASSLLEQANTEKETSTPPMRGKPM
jgi:hypothetical protein